ncbi:hypothetical protein U1Q18_040590 [Sarracenia purpurea var. burkii]
MKNKFRGSTGNQKQAANEAKGEGDGFTDTVEIRPNSSVGERIASPSVALEGGAAETGAEKQAEVSVEEEAAVKVGAAPTDQVNNISLMFYALKMKRRPPMHP